MDIVPCVGDPNKKDERPFVYETDEARLDDPSMKGKLLHLMVIVRRARGIPTKLMSQVFVSFKFFLRKEPCATARCGAVTTNPRFEQTIALKQAREVLSASACVCA